MEEVEQKNAFGLPKVNTKSAIPPKTPFKLAEIPEKPKIFEGVAKILFVDAINRLLDQGSLDLDLEYTNSQNPKIMQIRTKYPDIKSPYCKRKLYVGIIKVRNKEFMKTVFERKDGTKGCNSHILYMPYKNDSFYCNVADLILAEKELNVVADRIRNNFGNLTPDKLRTLVATMRGKDESKIKEARDQLYANFQTQGYPVFDVTAWLSTETVDKIDLAVKTFVEDDNLTTLSQEKVIAAFISEKIILGKADPQSGQRQFSFNVDDVWFFRP